MNKSDPAKPSSITVVIAGSTYALRADDLRGMRDMPAGDRDQLIALLELLKAQREQSQRTAQVALAKSVGGGAVGERAAMARGERLGKGDVDAIMARLAAEERQQRKPGLRRATIYKVAAGSFVIILLLSVF